jgi:hypothetical protein
MALPTTSSFGGIILEVESSPGSGTYNALMCGFSQKAVDLTAQTSTAIVPDCNNPEAPAWDIAGISSIGGKITLSGIAASEDEATWNGWMDSGLSRNIRYRKSGVGYRSGPALLTSLGESVQLRQDANLVQRSITLENSGAWPWTAGDPV